MWLHYQRHHLSAETALRPHSLLTDGLSLRSSATIRYIAGTAASTRESKAKARANCHCYNQSLTLPHLRANRRCYNQSLPSPHLLTSVAFLSFTCGAAQNNYGFVYLQLSTQHTKGRLVLFLSILLFHQLCNSRPLHCWCCCGNVSVFPSLFMAQ